MAVLLAALVAGAAPAAEASIPSPETWPSVVKEPAESALELPSLEDLTAELVAPATSPATAAVAAAGEPFRLFEGLELGLARRSEPRFRFYPRLETCVWAITPPEPLHIELELPLTPSRFRLYGDPLARIAVGGTFLTTDPLGYVDGPNLYQYGLNNPINFTDPLGLQNWEIEYLHELHQEEQKLLAMTPEERAAYLAEQERQGLANSSALVGFIPIGGEIHDASQVLFGKDYVSGEELSDLDRGLALGGFFVPMVGGKIVREAGGWILGRVGRWLGFDELAEAGVRGFEEGAHEAVEGMTPRFRSDPGQDLFLPGEYYDSRLNRRAPGQSSPYARHERFNAEGDLEQVTTYDLFGDRVRQYDLGDSARHGEGYHAFEYDAANPRQDPGGGRRGPHVPFEER